MPANPIPYEHPHDCTLSPCKLTDWTFTRYHMPEKSEYAVVYGTVAQDDSGRFAAGSRIRTSPVTQWSAPLAHTHNSVYCLPVGAGCFCDLPATLQSAIDSLGIDPTEAAVILRNAFMQPAHAFPETAFLRDLPAVQYFDDKQNVIVGNSTEDAAAKVRARLAALNE